jgi:hypothetical protein
MWDAERTKQRDRTKTGVLLLLIGSLLSWIPFNIGLFGSILILIGAILVILGRKAFGPSHARNVVVSIVVLFLGIIIAFVGGIIALVSALVGQTTSPATVQAGFNNLLIASAVGGIISGLASVFFTFGLQKQMGKMLLLAGYGAGILVSIVIFVVASAAVPEFVAVACPGGTCSQEDVMAALASFQSRVGGWGLLQAIPAILYAGAYYLVWNRISKGEIPAPPAAPGMPPAIQPR